MTIKDIARMSGYGVGTVSRVLNNSPNVSEKARKAILAVAQEYNFQPNENARRLRNQTRSGISLIVKGRQNMLFEPIIEKMQVFFANAGYACTVTYIDETENEVATADHLQVEQKPYGCVFLGSNLSYFERDHFLEGLPAIIVTNNASTVNHENLSSVSTDDYAASVRMIDYLYDMGHRNIGIIGSDPKLSRPSLMRLSGAQSAFMKHGMTLDLEKQYAHSWFTLQGGYDAAKELIDRNPGMTAIFAMSDTMAIGAIRALYDNGYRVPNDISVTGFDGIELSRFCHPTLTTIRQNVDRMAERGVEILVNAIENKAPAVYENVGFELQVGDSVRNIAEG